MNECGTKPECADIADRAVRKTFAILGVNIDNPESVEEFRQDLRFGKQLRKIASHGTLAFFAAVAVAIAGAIWIGITSTLGGNGK